MEASPNKNHTEAKIFAVASVLFIQLLGLLRVLITNDLQQYSSDKLFVKKNPMVILDIICPLCPYLVEGYILIVRMRQQKSRRFVWHGKNIHVRRP